MAFFRGILKSWLLLCKSKLSAHQELKAFAVRVLARFPQLDQRLRNLGSPYKITTQTRRNLGGPDCLSPRARQIYFNLKVAREQHHEGKR